MLVYQPTLIQGESIEEDAQLYGGCLVGLSGRYSAVSAGVSVFLFSFSLAFSFFLLSSIDPHSFV